MQHGDGGNNVFLRFYSRIFILIYTVCKRLLFLLLLSKIVPDVFIIFISFI